MDVLAELQRAGAVLQGHFQLSSGRHSDTYFEKFHLLYDPEVLSALCHQLSEPFQSSGVEFVVGPTLGGAIVAYEMSRQLGAKVRYLEREGGVRLFRRGAVPDGAKTLLVDDVLTTGLSLRECLPALSHVALVGIGVLLSRMSDPGEWPAPFHALHSMDVESWAPSECPLCRAGEPLSHRGSRYLP